MSADIIMGHLMYDFESDIVILNFLQQFEEYHYNSLLNYQ